MGEVKYEYITIEEYLAQELKAEYKSEYEKGKVRSMSGGTINHARIATNITSELNGYLKSQGNPCLFFNSDARVYIDRAESFVYPDGFVVCGDIEISPNDKNSIVNPSLVIEVLSESTEAYDRSAKFRKYCSLASFKEYMLVTADQPIVEMLYRQEKGVWQMKTIMGLDKSVTIQTLGIEVPMKDIYNGTINLNTPPILLDF